MSDYTKLRDLILTCEGKYCKRISKKISICTIIPYDRKNEGRCEYQTSLYNIKFKASNIPVYKCLRGTK